MRRLAALLVFSIVVIAGSSGALMPKEMQRDAGMPGDAGGVRPEARALMGAGIYAGELAVADFQDWYRIDVLPGERLQVSMTSLDNMAFELVAPDGSVAVKSSTAIIPPATYRSTPGVPGGWSIFVHGIAVGTYELRVSFDIEAVHAAPVVVATFDTGTNPFHPCFRRALNDPHDIIPTYPAGTPAIDLAFEPTYAASLQASQNALAAITPWTLHRVPGTSLSYYGAANAANAFVDTYPHGAQASSQIGCAEFGMAPNAHLVIVNWYDDTNAGPQLIRWAADQPFIDIIHLNIQDWPLLVFSAPEVEYAVAKGKLVVVAAGNGVGGLGPSYPSELSKWNGPPGTLVAGANENGGYAAYSNLDPDVVMDGAGTAAASPNSFGETTFSGTSSASPRVTGYAARLLGELRADFGHTGAGLLTIPAGRALPLSGPLTDGVLTAEEFHEVIRKTADPNPHASRYDGSLTTWWQPQPVALPFAFYPKMGYGEVSEHTLDNAFAVLAGRADMPARPIEDEFWAAGQTFRHAWW